MNLTTSDRRAFLGEYYRRRSLGHFITDVTPGFVEPTHLLPLMELFERIARGEQVRAVLAVPPRHTKTESVLHGCAWLLQRDPTWTIGYASYAADFAATKCARAKAIAKRAGIEMSGRDREDYWETPQGGVVRSNGIGGQWAGSGYRLVIADDPIKNREEAESPRVRDKTFESFTSDLLTRQDPAGTSFLVVHTRWHMEDLGGRLVARGWPYIRLPAISDAGAPLWPEFFPLSRLEKIRSELSTYEWESLYQGNPIPRGAAIFGDPVYCSKADIPTNGIRVGAGFDLAYSAKTHADRSALVVLVEKGGEYYVADVMTMQSEAPQFLAAARERLAQWPKTKPRWHASGTEKGLADLSRELGLTIDVQPAVADKFVRAQPVAAAWQTGKIRVPRDAPWAHDFLEVVQRFTGLGDRRDDEVDALASAFDMLRRPAFRAF